MEKKKNFTIEELEGQLADLNAASKVLSETIANKKKEEKEKKEAQLALEKETRKAEVDEAFANYNKLLQAYIKDYGTYSTTTSSDDFDWFPNSFWRSFF